jgi:hypothetical protein
LNAKGDVSSSMRAHDLKAVAVDVANRIRARIVANKTHGANLSR